MADPTYNASAPGGYQAPVPDGILVNPWPGEATISAAGWNTILAALAAPATIGDQSQVIVLHISDGDTDTPTVQCYAAGYTLTGADKTAFDARDILGPGDLNTIIAEMLASDGTLSYSVTRAAPAWTPPTVAVIP